MVSVVKSCELRHSFHLNLPKILLYVLLISFFASHPVCCLTDHFVLSQVCAALLLLLRKLFPAILLLWSFVPDSLTHTDVTTTVNDLLRRWGYFYPMIFTSVPIVVESVTGIHDHHPDSEWMREGRRCCTSCLQDLFIIFFTSAFSPAERVKEKRKTWCEIWNDLKMITWITQKHRYQNHQRMMTEKKKKERKESHNCYNTMNGMNEKNWRRQTKWENRGGSGKKTSPLSLTLLSLS